MDASRSFYLNSRQSDFPSAGTDITDTDIPCVVPGNDNAATKRWLLVSCRFFSSAIRREVRDRRLTLTCGRVNNRSEPGGPGSLRCWRQCAGHTQTSSWGSSMSNELI